MLKTKWYIEVHWRSHPFINQKAASHSSHSNHSAIPFTHGVFLIISFSIIFISIFVWRDDFIAYYSFTRLSPANSPVLVKSHSFCFVHVVISINNYIDGKCVVIKALKHLNGLKPLHSMTSIYFCGTQVLSHIKKAYFF